MEPTRLMQMKQVQHPDDDPFWIDRQSSFFCSYYCLGICLLLHFLGRDSPGSALTTSNQSQHRRQISGHVSNHRPAPLVANHTPPRRSSNAELQFVASIHRLSTSGRPILNDDNSSQNNVNESDNLNKA